MTLALTGSTLTIAAITAISKARPKPAEHIHDFVVGMTGHAKAFGLNPATRAAHFIAQIMHETGGLRWNKEIWGPTAAQRRYEGRADLGNVRPGDGSKFRGYGFIQVTGRANATAFRNWCRAKGLNPPDFAERPELMATAPWSTLCAFWFWDTRSLNAYADTGNIEMITRRINGGLNGFADRLDYFTRTGLVMLGYHATAIATFQKANRLDADGIAGPKTRAALHAALEGA